jgi:hypothetical protein
MLRLLPVDVASILDQLVNGPQSAPDSEECGTPITMLLLAGIVKLAAVVEVEALVGIVEFAPIE